MKVSTAEYVDPDVIKMMLVTMQHENALAIMVSLHTGLRIGDVLRLRPGDIDDNHVIRTVAQKTKKPVTAPIPAELHADLLRISGNGWVFPSPSGRAQSGRRCRQTVWRDVVRAAERLRVKAHVTPHTARKIFAVETFRNGGDLDAARDALQHDRITTTMIYAFADKLTDTKKKKPPTRSEMRDGAVVRFLAAFVDAVGGYDVIDRAVRAAIDAARKQF